MSRYGYRWITSQWKISAFPEVFVRLTCASWAARYHSLVIFARARASIQVSLR
ncbi:hypothetical protein SERLA73DRAFT_182526 [Serpula lacrymans var. lacrymans S7.3]|uniref:Uncharacterized protein n=1 Tax=Serpula lacrymans var. lacrymans (strain S7.3) TaxID=936435 RepID=F8Q0F0_SERL3|nr:hypothetical protein SERLA73DRAFT_182526 [Serpula lacrymans var. lacrymans S7.3]